MASAMNQIACLDFQGNWWVVVKKNSEQVQLEHSNLKLIFRSVSSEAFLIYIFYLSILIHPPKSLAPGLLP